MNISMLEKQLNELVKDTEDYDERLLLQIILMKKIIELELKINGNGSMMNNLPGFGNCNDECVGWDGFSRRCECNNRRFQWTISFSHSNHYASGFELDIRPEQY
jgi:hypothetical protein